MSRRMRSHWDRRGDRPIEPLMRRLERAAQDLNPILLIIVLGLAVLNFSVYAALCLAPLSHHAMLESPDAGFPSLAHLLQPTDGVES